MEPGRKVALARRYASPALTQARLAARLGVDRSTLARWETRNGFPREMIDRAAAILGVERPWFDVSDELPPPKLAPGNVRGTNDEAVMGAAGKSLQRGDQVMLSVWRGVMASDGECEFWPSESLEFRAIPSFLASSDPDAHVLCIASGVSMAPRLDHAERAVVKLDADPPIGAIVVARRPDGANFIKVLRRGAQRLELHSLNPEFSPIVDVRDWALKGFVVAIVHTYSGGSANIEWDDGRPLRA